jgi:hypothetical protein
MMHGLLFPVMLKSLERFGLETEMFGLGLGLGLDKFCLGLSLRGFGLGLMKVGLGLMCILVWLGFSMCEL